MKRNSIALFFLSAPTPGHRVPVMLRAIFREGEKKTKPKMRAHEAVYKRTLTLNFPKIYGVSSGGAGGAGGTYSTKKKEGEEAKTRL